MKNLLSRRIAMELLGAAVIWGLSWVAPWQSGLLGISAWLTLLLALGLFILPGALLFSMLNPGRPRLLGSLAAGFVLSHLIVASLGLLGRIAGYSFQVVRYGFAIAGLLIIAAFVSRRGRQGTPGADWQAAWSEAKQAWPLIIGVVFAFLLSLRPTFSVDDLSYLAYVTNWQFAAKLNFSNVLFGLDLADMSRFWLSLLPMSYALLSDLSRIAGIFLLGAYLQPFLAVLALIALYEVSRALGLSPRWAATAVILQVLFLVLFGGWDGTGIVVASQPGAMFFDRLSEDKVLTSFLFAPAFITSLLAYHRQPTRHHLALMLLLGLSFTLAHPIPLVYTLIIGGLMTLLWFWRERRPRESVATVAAMAVVVVPQGVLRFIGDPFTRTVTSVSNAASTDSALFNSLVYVLNGGPFYSFSPQLWMLNVIWIERPFIHKLVAWSWLAVPLLIAILAALRIKDSLLARYIFAASLLITVAGVPYLGWTLGYFVSAQMLYRTLWLYPFGLGFAFLFFEIVNGRIGGQVFSPRFRDSLPVITGLLSLVYIAYAAWQATPTNLANLSQELTTYQEYALIGRNLDAAIPVQAVVLSPDPIADFLPGISAHAKVVSFRNWRQGVYFGLPEKDARTRQSDVELFYEGKPTFEERRSILDKYHVTFVILRPANRWVQRYSEYFRPISGTPTFTLYAFDAGAGALEGRQRAVSSPPSPLATRNVSRPKLWD